MYFVLFNYLFLFVVAAISSQNCTENGGFCTKSQHCFNPASQEPCKDNPKTVCCQPKPNDTCVDEACGQVIRDCVFELSYNYRHPMICKLFERCGITRDVFLKRCISSQIRLTCCAQESTTTPTGEIIGPNGDVEGIMFNGLEPTNSHTTSFWVAGVAALVSLIAISAIVWIKVRNRIKGNQFAIGQQPNTNLTTPTI